MNPAMIKEIPVPIDTDRVVRNGVLMILASFGLFVLWAVFAPLDEGVPLMGTVVVDSQRKPVQHQEGGIVAEVFVKDGQSVTEGQPLLALDVVLQQGQQHMLQSRIAGMDAQVQSLQRIIPERQAQVNSLANDVRRLQPLVAEDMYPRNRFNETQRQLSTLQAQLSSDKAALQTTMAELQEAKEQLALLSVQLERAIVKAPAAGTVMAPMLPTAGSVVGPGQVLMEVVPPNGRLLIEAQVPPHYVEQVRADLPAQLRFSALDPRKTPVINGHLDLISADVVRDDQGNAFYHARLSATPEEVARLGEGVVLHPGMPVEAVVVTGERSFLNYLVKPLTDSFARALKER